jgi:hypothetical protein
MMQGLTVKGAARRIAVDAMLGLGLFIVFSMLLAGVPRLRDIAAIPAHAGELAKAAAHTVAVAPPAVSETRATQVMYMVQVQASQPSRWAGVAVLGLVFTALFTFNLAFFRHLSRTYASPRRRQENARALVLTEDQA